MVLNLSKNRQGCQQDAINPSFKELTERKDYAKSDLSLIRVI